MKNEPVMAVATILAAVLAVAGVVIDANSLFVVISAVLPLLTGLIQRSKVIPVAKVVEAAKL